MELGDQKNGKHKTNGHAKPRKPQEPIGTLCMEKLFNQCGKTNVFSLWRRSRNFCPFSYLPFTASCCCLFTIILVFRGQSCSGKMTVDLWYWTLSAGVWAFSHISPWSSFIRRSARSWSLFHNSVCWHLWENRHEKPNIWNPTPGGMNAKHKSS